jgi:hypothetical protein
MLKEKILEAIKVVVKNIFNTWGNLINAGEEKILWRKFYRKK